MAIPDWEMLDQDWVWKKVEEAASDPDFFRRNFLSNPVMPEIFPLEGEKGVANRHFNWHKHVIETDNDTAADSPVVWAAALNKETDLDG